MPSGNNEMPESMKREFAKAFDYNNWPIFDKVPEGPQEPNAYRCTIYDLDRYNLERDRNRGEFREMVVLAHSKDDAIAFIADWTAATKSAVLIGDVAELNLRDGHIIVCGNGLYIAGPMGCLEESTNV